MYFKTKKTLKKYNCYHIILLTIWIIYILKRLRQRFLWLLEAIVFQWLQVIDYRLLNTFIYCNAMDHYNYIDLLHYKHYKKKNMR
jgi:hypothetical protein